MLQGAATATAKMRARWFHPVSRWLHDLAEIASIARDIGDHGFAWQRQRNIDRLALVQRDTVAAMAQMIDKNLLLGHIFSNRAVSCNQIFPIAVAA